MICELLMWNWINLVLQHWYAALVFVKCVFGSARLTGEGAAQNLQPHAEGAVPALRDDSDVASDHGHSEPVHHWSVLITVCKEQLDIKVKRGVSGWWKRGGCGDFEDLMVSYPVSIPIVDGGPFSAVVAESQEVGQHKVTPEMTAWEKRVEFGWGRERGTSCREELLTQWESLALEWWLLWTPSPCEHRSRTSGWYPQSLRTTLHPSCCPPHQTPGNSTPQSSCCHAVYSSITFALNVCVPAYWGAPSEVQSDNETWRMLKAGRTQSYGTPSPEEDILTHKKSRYVARVCMFSPLKQGSTHSLAPCRYVVCSWLVPPPPSASAPFLSKVKMKVLLQKQLLYLGCFICNQKCTKKTYPEGSKGTRMLWLGS